MLNEPEHSGVTTREIAAIVPITVAEYQDAESGWWCVEGLDYPVAIQSTDLNLAENHVRQHVAAGWRHWCGMVNALNAPQPEHMEGEGYE